MIRLVIVALLVAFAGCGQDVDPPWQLDHDRVIAIRLTPARIASGEVTEVDALIGFAGGAPPVEADPDTAEVVSPARFASALARDANGWTVTAPPGDQLAAARVELGLAAGEPVPLRLRVTFAPLGLIALKIVWLGVHVDNPVLGSVLINGAEAVTETQITVAPAIDVPLAVGFDDETHDVNWLTSCGTMHDFDLPTAYLRVEPEDPHAGSIAVVVRDDAGGVAWRVWPITAQ